jgi:putative SOS response-associated peptidase YedK
MSGRYRWSRRKQIVEEYSDCDRCNEDWNPRHNIAPTNPVPLIRQHPKEPARQLLLMRWGLIPHWTKDLSISASTINAKSETAARKPAFRDPLRFRRCLIPADGFYDWKRMVTIKQPYCFEVNNGDLFAFAGLWDGWKDSRGRWVTTCTILTTMPNALTSTIHDTGGSSFHLSHIARSGIPATGKSLEDHRTQRSDLPVTLSSKVKDQT